MKTFIYDAISRFKRWSEELDVQTILCSKAWQVFNDSGEKEVYVFQPDGRLIISLNGRVSNGTWQYLHVNRSLVIDGAGQSYMLRPAFLDDVVFALRVDGTQECAFMIDEERASTFAPKTYTDLLGYLCSCCM